jgi:membrane-associated phospholipid phosphatase
VSRTAIGPVWTELRRRFRQGRQLIGPAAWRAWGVAVASGAAFMLVLMWVLVRAAQALIARGDMAWETDFLLWLGHDSGYSFATGVFFQTFGTDITLVILLTAASALAVWRRRPITALSIWLAPLVVDLVGRVGWAMWDRARPDVLWEGVASPAFHSFPSGHTSKTFAAYGFLTLLWFLASRSGLERALAVLMFAFIAVVTPMGRMLIGVHWPSDVIAGWLLGITWVAILGWAHRFERRALAAAAPSAAGRPYDPARAERRPA